MRRAGGNKFGIYRRVITKEWKNNKRIVILFGTGAVKD
jgi:hypothetical protein